jgi:hypothetical protein
LNDRKEGKGTYRFANGDVYVGDWKADKRHGKGELVCANGNRYVGKEDCMLWCANPCVY